MNELEKAEQNLRISIEKCNKAKQEVIKTTQICGFIILGLFLIIVFYVTNFT